MFNVSGGEFLIVVILALVLLGPDKLPEFIRKAGQFYGQFKKMSAGFKSEFQDVMAEPMREFQDTANMARSWFDEGRSAFDALEDDPEGPLSLPPAQLERARSSEPGALEGDPIAACDDDPALRASDGTELDAEAIRAMLEPPSNPSHALLDVDAIRAMLGGDDSDDAASGVAQ